MAYHRIFNIVPYAIQCTLSFTHSLYTSLYLLTPNSQSFPPQLRFPLATTSRFSLFMSLFCKSVHCVI